MKRIRVGDGYSVFLAAWLSLFTVFMSRTHFENGVYEGIDVNYMGEFGFSAVVLFVFCFCLYWFLIRKAEPWVVRWVKKISLPEPSQAGDRAEPGQNKPWRIMPDRSVGTNRIRADQEGREGEVSGCAGTGGREGEVSGCAGTGGREGEVSGCAGTGGRRMMYFWGILMFLVWLPYYLSYYPGGIYADTIGSISYYYAEVLTNRHPFLYNLLIAAAIRFGEFLNQDLTWSLGLFFAVQMLLLQAEVLFLLWWMLGHRVNRFVRRAVMIFMVFFPLIPLYGVSIWKDTPFCMVFLLWLLFLTDLYLEFKKGFWRRKTLIGFVACMILIAFTRNNGTYVVFLSAVVLAAATFGLPFGRKKVVYGAIAAGFALIVFVQGPVYRWLGVIETGVEESLAIPLQQIGAVVAYEGEITEEQKETIDRFIPYENISGYYTPCLSDNLKFNAGLDQSYLAEHMGEFLGLWAELLIQNPGIYVNAYLLETVGFWNIQVGTADAYVQNYVWPYEWDVEQKDYFSEWFGFSFQDLVNPRSFISGAWFFWFFFLCMIFCMKRYGRGTVCLFAPQMGLWLTLMIATPIASSLRYIAPLMFAVGLVVILPLLLERELPDAGQLFDAECEE